MTDFIKSVKKNMETYRKIMQGQNEDKPQAQPQQVKTEGPDMSSEAMKKRDEEYRRRGWIK